MSTKPSTTPKKKKYEKDDLVTFIGSGENIRAKVIEIKGADITIRTYAGPDFQVSAEEIKPRSRESGWDIGIAANTKGVQNRWGQNQSRGFYS